MARNELTYVRTSTHDKKPGENHFGEEVLPDPRGLPMYNHRSTAAMKRMTDEDWTDEQIDAFVEQAEADDLEERREQFIEWAIQDERFASKERNEAQHALAEQELEAAEQRKKEEEKLAAWGNRKRVDAMPAIRHDTAEITDPIISVPPAVRTAAEKNEYFHLAEFHPEQQNAFTESSLDNQASGQTGMVFDMQPGGGYALRPAGRATKAPKDLDCTLEYLLIALTAYIRALKQWGMPSLLSDGWAAVRSWIENHSRRGSPLGDEWLRMVLVIHRREWHAIASTRAPNNPIIMGTDIEFRAQTKLEESREIARRAADAARDAQVS
jgi:hypothetical protein